MALHAYARKYGEEYLGQLMKRICKRADAWAHEGNHPFMLAMISAGQGIKNKENNKSNDYEQEN